MKTDKDEKKNFVAYIKKGKEGDKEVTCSTVKGLPLVVFSGDLDKAIASFIIATGAAFHG